jgi:UDP-3-O-[3-hydroxymyristoyl] glucosamine N-acyltransferase
LKGAIVFIAEEFEQLRKRYPKNIFIMVENVAKAMMKVRSLFYSEIGNVELKTYQNSNADTTITVGAGAYISPNVCLGQHVSIGAGATIMANSNLFDDVSIGEGTLIEPGVTVYRGSRIGNHTIVHAGACIGTDGHRFFLDIENQTILKMIHAGYVVVGNKVEIGCNSTICRATFEDHPTVISDEVKIAHQVDIGHNVRIGPRTTIAPQTCISGSTKIGEDVWIGTGVSVSNDLTIGNRASLLFNAVVADDVPDGEIVSGFYAMPHRQWQQVFGNLKKMAAGDQQTQESI